jgi:hypothetical protein
MIILNSLAAYASGYCILRVLTEKKTNVPAQAAALIGLVFILAKLAPGHEPTTIIFAGIGYVCALVTK